MQTGRGRGHRPRLPGKDRLVALPVSRLVGAPDIRGQRHMAVGFQERKDRLVEGQPEQVALAADPLRERAALQVYPRTRTWCLAGPDLGLGRMLSGGPLDEDLHPAAGVLFPENARRNDPGIVENQQVPGVQ